MFDASRHDGRIFSIRMEIDAASSNGVEVIFGSDENGDGILSRTEAALAVGYDCGDWKVEDVATGTATLCAGSAGHAVFDWKLRLGGDRLPLSLAAAVNGAPVFVPLGLSPPRFLFDPAWNAAKIVRRGQFDPHPRIVCSVDNDPIILFIR